MGGWKAVDRVRRVSPQVWDRLLALGVLLGAAITYSAGSAPASGAFAAQVLLLVAACLPLAFRHRWPLGVLVVTGVATALFPVVSSGTPTELALIVASYSAASLLDRREVTRLALPIASACALVAQIAEQRHGNWVEVLVGVSIAVLLPMLFGRIVYNRRLRIRLDRERAASDAVAEERARIARELHDVVAHAIGVMVVQAGAARTVIDRDPAAAKTAMAEVETTGRTGLAEMRRLIGVLTADGAAGELAPHPGLAQLDELVRTVRSAGLAVEVLREGEARPLPAGVDVNAYRVIQEALTNALKHAGTAHASVRLGYRDDALDIEVADDGRGPLSTGDGSGHGLVGMRERVGVFGGTLETGARPGGGFVVHATLPVTEDGPT
jgi:signal transduction histidine kinase